MSAEKTARLADRGVVSITGPDSEKLLQGLITNDVEGLTAGTARHAALLSPQGKILFDFFVVRTRDGYLLDVAAAKAGELVKRLTMYKLRADVAIMDASDRYVVGAQWDGEGHTVSNQVVYFADPRHPSMGSRILAHSAGGIQPNGAQRDYDAHRVSIGVPEGGKDYDFADAYPHEADFDLFNGVSFSKGCYVGQEVVARMQNKTVVRKRVVKITADGPLTSGADISIGDVVIGRVGTVAGNEALAMLRLDRAIEAQEQNRLLTSAGVYVTPDATALERYRRSAAARAPAANPT